MNVKNSAAGEFKRSPAPIEAGVQGVPSGTQAALPSSFPESDENLSREIPDDLLTPIWSGRAGCASGTQAVLPPLSGTDRDLLREVPDDLLLRSVRAYRVCLRHLLIQHSRKKFFKLS